MPIRVIRIEKYKDYAPKLIPGIIVKNRHNSMNSIVGMPTNSVLTEFDKTVFDNASEVYTKSDVDEHIASIEASISELSKKNSEDISSSLRSIREMLTSLKQEIINSKSFREQLKQDILQELKNDASLK